MNRKPPDKDRPGSIFSTKILPPEPIYSSIDSWAALPGKKSGAYLAPENTRFPEFQENALVDVFFIHPTTTYAAHNNWNIPIDDSIAVFDLDIVLSLFASVFNAAAKVYAPRYREANIYAFFEENTDWGIKAIDLAYSDVKRAFIHYMENHNKKRAFILAGHSQGSIHGLRLLQEYIIGTPLMNRMVAAYLIGGTIPKDIPGIRPSQSSTDTGVTIGWNTYTKDGDPSIFTNDLVTWIDGSYIKTNGIPLLQVNPLSWKLNGSLVTPSHNLGSLPFPATSDKKYLLSSGVCGADASGKVLIIDKPSAKGFTLPKSENDMVFNPEYGDYHIFDYMLFYESIRQNAIDRVKSFLVK